MGDGWQLFTKIYFLNPANHLAVRGGWLHDRGPHFRLCQIVFKSPS